MEKVELQVFPEERVTKELVPKTTGKEWLKVWDKKVKSLRKLMDEVEKRNVLLTAQRYADDVLYSHEKFPSTLPMMDSHLKLLQKINKKVNNMVELILDYMQLYQPNVGMIDPVVLKEELLALIVPTLIDPVSKYAIFLPGYEEDLQLLQFKELLKELVGNLVPIEVIDIQFEDVVEDVPRRRSPTLSMKKTKKRIEELSEKYASSMIRSPRRSFQLKEDRIKSMEKKVKKAIQLLEDYESDEAKKIIKEIALDQELVRLVNERLLKKLKKIIIEEFRKLEANQLLTLLGL
jgi:hypothetical protein